MGLADEWDVEDLARVGAYLFVGYVLLNYLRDRSATDSGGADFTGSAPNFPAFDNAIDILAPMQVSPSGVEFIKRQEGLTLVKKNDAGHQMIGYGHDILPDEKIPSPITPGGALQLLKKDLAQTATVINRALKVAVTQNQFDALASLEYNIGAGAFQSSTLLTKLNQGDYAGAAQEFSRWNRTQGQVSQGLSDRRGQEQGLFNTA